MAKASTAIAATNPFTALVPKGGSAPIINSQSTSPYLILLHSQQNTYGQIVRAIGHDKTCTPVYVNGEIIKEMNPCKFIVTPTYYQCYAVHNSDGSLTEVQEAEGRCPEGKKDTIFMVIILVDSNFNLYPARIRIQGPRARGFKDAILMVNSETTADDWAKRSKAHTLACAKGLPLWATAVHQLSYKTGIQPKIDPDKKKKPYDLTSVTSEPCPALLVNSLLKMGTNEELVSTLNACVEDYNKELPQGLSAAAR